MKATCRETYGCPNTPRSCRRLSSSSSSSSSSPVLVILYCDRYSIKALFYTILACIICLLIIQLLSTPNAPQFYLNSLFIGPPNYPHDAKSNSTKWVMDFSVSNPNKQTRIDYDLVQVLVLDETGVVISSSMLGPFYQEGLSQTLLHANGEATMSSLSTLSSSLDYFNVKIEAIVRLNRGLPWESKGWVRASCRDLKVTFSTPHYLIGKSLEGSTQCLAYLQEDFHNAAAADDTNCLLQDCVM